MGEAKYKTHLNTLKEMILDEEKLVTYVSISKEFCIHVNESKSLMNEAVEDIRKKQPDTKLNVSHIISGLAENNKARTFVCPEDDVSECRKGLKLLFFNHIYSINKGNPSVDKVAFMAVTSFDDYQLCSGLVKSNDCIKRTSDEIGRLKLNSQVQVSQSDQTVTKPPPKKVKEEIAKDSNMNGHGDAKKVSKVKSEPTIKQEKTSPQKENVNGKQKPEVKKSQKGIAGFFSRSDSAPVKKTTKESTINKPENKSKLEKGDAKVKVEEMDVDEDIDFKKTAETNAKISEKTVVNNGKNKKANNNNKAKDSNKSLTQIKKNAKVDKKRKRVLHVSDSESEEEKNDPFVDEEDVLDKRIDIDSEDEIPPTPAVNTIKVASNMLNPRKKRKIVTKTFTDEDGYILTKKEEVYESLSENEDITDTKENIEEQKKIHDKSPKEKSASLKTEVSPTKKSGPKNSRKKISPPQKGKQATLMSFFKKA